MSKGGGGDYIKIDRYEGGFVLNRYWTVELSFHADRSGELKLTRKGETKTAKFDKSFDQQVKGIVDGSGIFTIPSADGPGVDKEYDNPLVHVNYHGKHFYHTPPEGTFTPSHPPTPQQQEIFVNFTNQILVASNKLIPDVPTDIFQM